MTTAIREQANTIMERLDSEESVDVSPASTSSSSTVGYCSQFSPQFLKIYREDAPSWWPNTVPFCHPRTTPCHFKGIHTSLHIHVSSSPPTSPPFLLSTSLYLLCVLLFTIQVNGVTQCLKAGYKQAGFYTSLWAGDRQ